MIGPQDERVVSFKVSGATRVNSGGRRPGGTAVSKSTSFARNTFTNTSAGQTMANAVQPTAFVQQRHAEETRAYKGIIDKLTSKLNSYQERMAPEEKNMEATHIQNIRVGIDEEPQAADLSSVDHLMGAHLLAPLFKEYERQVSNLEAELQARKVEVARKSEVENDLVGENEKLSDALTVKTQEYLKLVEETRNDIDLLNKGANNRQELEAELELQKQRVQLLSEENQVLFEQVTLLRAHHDQFSADSEQLLAEANQKSQKFDKLNAEYNQKCMEVTELMKTNGFLDHKLSQNTQMMGTIEEGRRSDQTELRKMREQLSLFQKEYQFYKQLSEKLELKQSTEMEQLSLALRETSEREKDLQVTCEHLSKENAQATTSSRQLTGELQRMQRDMKQIMGINEEYETQADKFREREMHFGQLTKEYREKLEQVKFERERLALKEEQFVKQIRKTEADQKQSIQKITNTFESKLMTRQRDMNRKYEELEERFNSAQDDAETASHKAERTDALNWEQRRQLDDRQKKEDRLVEQYERILEKLRGEIKDRERECHEVENRMEIQKQDVVRKLQQAELKLDFTQEKLSLKESQTLEKQSEITMLRERSITLQAQVTEADKTREMMSRQFMRVGEVEA